MQVCADIGHRSAEQRLELPLIDRHDSLLLEEDGMNRGSRFGQ
jgi:hypothetical protein